VGKVGAESPTFVEPVSQRRDGIQAMFARQLDRNASPSMSQASPSKRKRNHSADPVAAPSKRLQLEVIELCEDDSEDTPRVEKMNTWEDDSDIEYIDRPACSPARKVSLFPELQAHC
jgi:hypothetical protein